MKIKDIKAGGWVRYTEDNTIKLSKVRGFRYDKNILNGYIFHFEGDEWGLCFERKEFKYSDNVADLIRKGEGVIELDGCFYICNSFTKDEFVEKFGGEE